LARRILLADDSVTAQNMGRRILTDAGYDVITVNNGSAALKKIAENKPDLIVLDVYMPGYGGLEVCQRVKENPDTTRIPVLLTVGKLEPFKPDEARRVGADAFIIKPFEATELLTALTKLEDKIVAGPQPQKSGRFAKALAAVEQSDTGDRFGNQETGWKNRLTIPPPSFKPKQEEEEAIAPASRALDRDEASKPVEPSREFERPIPAGLPADITPEEIAAITAAAAAFGGKMEETAAAPPTVTVDPAPTQEVASSEMPAVQPRESEAPPVTQVAVPEVETKAPEVPAEAKPVIVEAVSEAVASGEAAKVEAQPAVAESPTVTAEADSATPITSETKIPDVEKPVSRDDEVMAAIASLAPSSGHAIENVPTVPQGSNGTGQNIPGSGFAAAVEAGAMGPRWIAESVAVALEESTAVLEHEMEQARAASVAVEAVASTLSTAPALESPSPAAVIEAAEPPIPAVASADAAAVGTESVSTPIAAEASRVEPPMVESVEPAMAKEESAYAAAASAGSAAEYPSPVVAVSPAVSPEFSESKPAAHTDGAPHREAELAAAWQNWKQIRESFVGSQPATQVAETPAAEVNAVPENAVQEEAPAPAETAPEEAAEATEVEAAASDAPEESTVIASMVDNMLAELRPKLVEEIAKKMNTEKKEKDKKKK
jgi:CheY-like chemotaxis protein